MATTNITKKSALVLSATLLLGGCISAPQTPEEAAYRRQMILMYMATRPQPYYLPAPRPLTIQPTYAAPIIPAPAIPQSPAPAPANAVPIPDNTSAQFTREVCTGDNPKICHLY